MQERGEKWCCRRGLNSRPQPYQGCALPLSYGSTLFRLRRVVRFGGRAYGRDNAVAQNFFSLLKRERIRRRTYKIRDEAWQGVFDCIEMFYSSIRKQARNGMLSPNQFERQQILKVECI